MKLKNIKVGDTVEVKKSILDVGINYTLEANDLCRVVEVESLAYEGDLTVSIQARGDTHWVSHKHLRKPIPKVSIGDEFVVVRSSRVHYLVGSKVTVSADNCDGTYGMSDGFHMTARKNGAFELCGLDVFLEKVDKQEQLTGSDLTRKILADGETSVLCYLSDENDDKAVRNRNPMEVVGYENGLFRTNGIFPWRYAVPVSAEEVTPLSRWTHSNGSAYTVILIANEHSENQDRYPTTVVYRDCDYEVWSKPLSDWHRSMTKMED